MTKLLNSAFEKVSALNETEQNIFARFILDEIDYEEKWDSSFSNSEEILSKMANEAVLDYKHNKTEVVNTDNL